MTFGEIDLFAALASLKLPVADYAVFGSGPLIIRGIIEGDNDLDVISRGAAWRRACEIGDLVHLDEHQVEIMSFFGGAITVGMSWAYGEFDIDNLIDTSETIGGIPFVRVEHVIRYKEIAARPKDLVHLSLLEHASSLHEDAHGTTGDPQ